MNRAQRTEHQLKDAETHMSVLFARAKLSSCLGKHSLHLARSCCPPKSPRHRTLTRRSLTDLRNAKWPDRSTPPCSVCAWNASLSFRLYRLTYPNSRFVDRSL